VLVRLLKTHRPTLILLAALQIVQAAAFLLLPTLTAEIVNDGLVHGEVGFILQLGAIMLGLTLVQVLARSAVQYLAARTATSVGRDLRTAVYRHAQSLSTPEIGRFGVASLATRTVQDVQQIESLLADALGSIVSAPVMCVVSVVLALREDVGLALVLVVLFPVAATVVAVVMARMGPLYTRLQSGVDGMNRVLREQITGVRVVRAFVRDGHEKDRFAARNEELYRYTLRSRRLAAVLPLVWLLGNVGSIAVIWFGGLRVADGTMPIGVLTALLGYLVLTLTSVIIAVDVLLTVPRARVSARRIAEVLDTVPSVRPPSEPVSAGGKGDVVLSGVSFSYPGAEEPALRDVDLTVSPGQTLGVIGGTGSGKTTVLELLTRQFDPTAGSVLVGGVDLRELGDLARVVGIVPQRAWLFAGTIAENLRFGRPEATDAELWRALQVAQASFVQDLDAPVEKGGGNLSGGQRQRLAIARALVHRPAVYLFDDCFSGLDYATEAALRSELAAEVADATVIVVAQRVSTIRDADRIAVFDEGRLVGLGSHEELAADNKTYREILNSQLTERETV
jgi:ATP-binding cassette subfamily B protein